MGRTRNTEEPENHHSCVWGQVPLMDHITEVYGYRHTDASSHMMLSSCDLTFNVPFLPHTPSILMFSLVHSIILF